MMVWYEYMESHTQENAHRHTISNITRNLRATASLWQPNKQKGAEMGTQMQSFGSTRLPAATKRHRSCAELSGLELVRAHKMGRKVRLHRAHEFYDQTTGHVFAGQHKYK